MGPWAVVVGVLGLSPLTVQAREAPKVGAEAKARTLLFTAPDAVVGEFDEQTRRIAVHQDFHLTGPGMEPEPFFLFAEAIESWVYTVLAVKGDFITRAKVTFGEVVHVTKSAAGRETRTPSPISHRTYVGESVNGRTQVTDADGKPVTDEEVRSKVLGELSGLGVEDALVDAFPKGPVKVGANMGWWAARTTPAASPSAAPRWPLSSTPSSRLHVCGARTQATI
ncbi:hypothetical protein [Pyxidicoccus trucidator]|uniref:hypothetical protein n=1 Tax=Pyxidicoccus trucidator TaxID=2709662 RepID=UPI0013DAEBB9|nr:hypothetical protein [Pyxidicoccus trucidator]